MSDHIYVTQSSMPPYEEYIEAIRPLWETHRLTNMGDYHGQLEQQLADYLDVPEISLTVNGHLALELAIQAFGFPPGSEVITTPFTFISTTHAIVRNHLHPVFCDVRNDDGTIDVTKIEQLITPKTVAILPVHVYGNACQTEEIEKLAYAYGLRVIYDAAHAFGIRYKGKGIGNYGDASIFSFHATKVFNSVEGGGVVCKNHDLYEKLYNLKNFGIRGEETVVSVGANAKMNELCAIMGLCNLRHVNEAMESRRKVRMRYQEVLTDIPGIRCLIETSPAEGNGAYYPVAVEESYAIDRDKLYVRFAEKGIHVRKYFYPLTSDEACFRNEYRSADLPIARRLSKQVLTLPVYEGMTEEEIDRVTEVLRENR